MIVHPSVVYLDDLDDPDEGEGEGGHDHHEGEEGEQVGKQSRPLLAGLVIRWEYHMLYHVYECEHIIHQYAIYAYIHIQYIYTYILSFDGPIGVSECDNV